MVKEDGLKVLFQHTKNGLKKFKPFQTVDKPHSCEGLNGVLFERIVIFPNCDEKTCKYGIFVGIMVIL